MLDQLPLVRGVVALVSDGGPFVLTIFSAGVLMWALILERYYFFWRILPKQVAAVQAYGHGVSNPHANRGSLQARARNGNWRGPARDVSAGGGQRKLLDANTQRCSVRNRTASCEGSQMSTT